MTRADGDEGSVALETVLVVPLLLLLLAAVLGAGRVTLAHQRVDEAAAQAARAAAAAASPSAARSSAAATAPLSLLGTSLDCRQMTVQVDTVDFRPGGSVSVQVACLADLGSGVPGLSGFRWISGRATEVIDTFREVHQ
jgi:Flp pilus assembly protein TadG